ncbi:MAG: CocE/NonD family hydrolase [Acidobacteriota bacterium]
MTNQSGNSISSQSVGLSRLDYIGTGKPDDRIPVEYMDDTDSNGYYSISVPDGTPGLDRVIVFSRSLLHYNELYDNIETSRWSPTYSDAQRADITIIDARMNPSGIDFQLDSNKQTFMVLMRDGVTHLATDLSRPVRNGSWPVVLVRTPYNKDSDGSGNNARSLFLPDDYAIVVQDVRGRYASEGEYKPFEDDGWGENQDGYDTIEWIAVQPWCWNGKIGMFGGSARGITGYCAAGAAPPSLDCVWATVGAPDPYQHMTFQGGSYRKELVDNWLDAQGASYMKDVYKEHPNYDDYWKQRNLFEITGNVRVPIFHQGGWYDIFDQGSIDGFVKLQEGAGRGGRWNQRLIMHPNTHGTMGTNLAGQLIYPMTAYDHQVNEMQHGFFDFWLKDIDTGIMDEPPARNYLMGEAGLYSSAPGNIWRTTASWPLASTPTKYYLRRNANLSITPPTKTEGSDSFTYDPLDPVPTEGGANLYEEAGPYDQRVIESRADMLSYTTDALTAPLEVSGNIKAHIFIETDVPDTDLNVWLTDVYNDGSSMLVLDGVLRARHYQTFEGENLLTPGNVYELVVDLWSTSLVFDAGHRIRVNISSSNDPRFDPNPNTGEPFRKHTYTQPANTKIYHSQTYASYIELPVVTGNPSGCKATTEVTNLTATKTPEEYLQLSWDPVSDGCFSEYRIYGADRPDSWVWFVRNPEARTTETQVVLQDTPFSYFLIVAGGTDGSNGPIGHFDK